MVEDHGWMYGGWKKDGAHTREWMNKTQKFIERAFSLPNNHGVKCPYSRCRNAVCEDKWMLTLHLSKVGFMPGYKVCTHHGELVHQIASVAEEEDDRRGDDRMDEMLNVIRSEIETNPKNPPTPEVQKFFDILRASEEPLYEHTTVSILAFVTRPMTIKSKFTFSNNCYKELLNLIIDVLLNNHKMPKDMYHSKKCCLLSVWSMRRLMCSKIIVCFSTKSTRNA
jgi:hypothetical protein